MKFKNNEELSKAYDELEKAYTKECQENKKLREQLKLVENKEIWQPKEDELYWTIAGNGEIWELYNNSDGDKMKIDYCNHFKTQEEAEKQAEYNRVMNRFRKYVEAYSEPLDWKDKQQIKYYTYYDSEYEVIIYTSDVTTYKDAFNIYASSKQILKDAIIYSAGSKEEFIRIVFGINTK